MNSYAARVGTDLQKRYPHEPEYLQSVLTWLEMIKPALNDPRYERLDLLSRMVEPDRMFIFTVPWTTTTASPIPTAVIASSLTVPSAPTKEDSAFIPT